MKLWILIVATMLLSFISLFIGAIDIKISDLFDWNSDETDIFLISRVPRLLAIILAGGAGMSIAGLIMQTLSRNKFVSPHNCWYTRCCKTRNLDFYVIYYKCNVYPANYFQFCIFFSWNISFHANSRSYKI